MKLTHKRISPRVGGEKHPYITTASKEALTQRLGKAEHEIPTLLSEFCDGNCAARMNANAQEQLEECCENCNVDRIMKILEGE